MRLAWFSPLPPSTSGIAAYSAELIPALEARGFAIDPIVEARAHDFVWQQRRRPYDLTVYQLGNALVHHYMWAYLFRYPGLVVLHDAQLHQARALALTKRWVPRIDDYLAEFEANHPGAPTGIGRVVAAGLGGSLYAHWPHIRLVLAAARLTLVHNTRLRDDLRDRYPEARIDHVPMGVVDPLARFGDDPDRAPRQADAATAVRRRHGIPDDAVVLAAFGGLTPEKRLGPLLETVRAIGGRYPQLRLLLVGRASDHYDVGADARRHGVEDRVHVTGFVADDELPAYLACADLCACLRWPTNRETSASWLRCLAAGRATLVTDLRDLADVPSLDPRGWRLADTVPGGRPPVAVHVDIADEGRCLQLALERLVGDAALRRRLGDAARAWWTAHHRLDAMADAYVPMLRMAAATPAPRVALPAHLIDDGTRHARDLAARLGVESRVAGLFEAPRDAGAGRADA